jgi:PAS domain S-box-containing protein
METDTMDGLRAENISLKKFLAEKVAEIEDLRQNEVNYFNFFDTIRDFVFILDEQARIIHVNRYVTERLGYTQEELAGVNVLEVHPEERRGEALEIVMAMLEGSAEFCPIPLRCKDGRFIPVETRVIRGKWNGKDAILGLSKDVSQLRLSEEKFSKAFNRSPILMAISLFETGQFIEVNQAFLKSVGLTRDQVIGRTSVELGIFNQEARNTIKSKTQESGKLSDAEIPVILKGMERVGLFSGDIIFIQDQKCLLSMMLDITEMKEKEKALRESNSTKERLLSIIAHDIRNPFNTIIGFSDLLKDYLKSNQTGKLMETADIIMNSAIQTHNMLENMLDWASLHKENLHADPTNFQLSALIEKIKIEESARISSKFLNLSVDIDKAIFIRADINMTRIVVRNLVSNAIKFTPRFGNITISANQEDGFIITRVKDSGIGIRPELLQKLFSSTMNHSRRGTDHEPGTGLGLTICRELVTMNGGRIWAESSEHEGSEFIFTLRAGQPIDQQ